MEIFFELRRVSCSKTIGVLCRSMLGVSSGGWYMKGEDDPQQTLRHPIFDEDNRARERCPSKPRSCVDRVCYLCFCGGGTVAISTITFHLRNFVR